MTNNQTITYLLKRNKILKDEIKITKLKICNIQSNINHIKNQKFYKPWRIYCHFKEYFTTHEN